MTAQKDWRSLSGQLALVPTGQALNFPMLLVALGDFTIFLSQGLVCFQDSGNACHREGLGETRLIALQSEKGKVVNFYV